MELLQNATQARLFEKLSAISPKSFDEFNRTIGAAVQEYLKSFGAVKAEYTISIPSNLPFPENIPGGGALFGELSEPAVPVRLQKLFDRGGLIVFTVYFKAGKILSPDERTVVNAVFGLVFHILEELIDANTYKKLMMVDLETGAATINAFMQFAGMLTATGQSRSYTAVYFNIRNFKSIHKSLSYIEGNRVMEQYCRTVTDALARNEMLARLGGDNFVALVLDEHRDYFLDLIQNMVIKYVKDDRVLTFVFGATMGIAKLTDETNPGDVMMHISTAYQAAREKRTVMSYYDQKTGLDIMERKIILSNFHKALNEHEFFVMYQPKVDVKTRTLVGAEALVRWKHGDGFIMPASFISVLEKDGCICALDFYMLDKVCQFIRKLFDSGVEPVKISVNFSKRHLDNNKLVEEIVETIDKYGVPHHLIEVELTESEDYHNQDVMRDIVDELNTLNIKSSIDDFGTGYSSLGMLSNLRLHELKVDRSFIPVNTEDENSKSMLMLKGVVNLAKSLGLTIVAEGVETPDQLALIENMGVDIVQGYYFDKPLTENDFIARIKRKVYPSE